MPIPKDKVKFSLWVHPQTLDKVEANYKKENSIVSEVSGIKIKDYTPRIDNAVSFSTIQAYKGLENTVIIMTDIESFEHEQLMYVGLSRARSGLFILESNSARKEYLNIQRRRFLEDGHKA